MFRAFTYVNVPSPEHTVPTIGKSYASIGSKKLPVKKRAELYTGRRYTENNGLSNNHRAIPVEGEILFRIILLSFEDYIIKQTLHFSLRSITNFRMYIYKCIHIPFMLHYEKRIKTQSKNIKVGREITREKKNERLFLAIKRSMFRTVRFRDGNTSNAVHINAAVAGRIVSRSKRIGVPAQSHRRTCRRGHINSYLKSSPARCSGPVGKIAKTSWATSPPCPIPHC